jgi:hypothetical protein
MVTRVLAAGQEDEEIRNSGILYLNEQDVKKKAFIIEGDNQTLKAECRKHCRQIFNKGFGRKSSDVTYFLTTVSELQYHNSGYRLL